MWFPRLNPVVASVYVPAPADSAIAVPTGTLSTVTCAVPVGTGLNAGGGGATVTVNTIGVPATTLVALPAISVTEGSTPRPATETGITSAQSATIAAASTDPHPVAWSYPGPATNPIVPPAAQFTDPSVQGLALVPDVTS